MYIHFRLTSQVCKKNNHLSCIFCIRIFLSSCLEIQISVYDRSPTRTLIHCHLLQPDLVIEFCKRNNLQLILRAHECVMDGFERFAQGRLITVFSATNYCGKFQYISLVFGRLFILIYIIQIQELQEMLEQYSQWAEIWSSYQS